MEFFKKYFVYSFWFLFFIYLFFINYFVWLNISNWDKIILTVVYCIGWRYITHFLYSGDSLAHSNGAYFSTMDSDNDNSKGSCAESYKAAWWSNKCFDSNLNGLIGKGKNGEPKYLTWYHWGNKWQSLKSAAMMVRPKKGAWITDYRSHFEQLNKI